MNIILKALIFSSLLITSAFTPLAPHISSSESIVLTKIKPTINPNNTSKIVAISEPTSLTSTQVETLLNLLLNDSSYIADATKKNVFVAQYMLEFTQDSSKFIIFINYADNQIQFTIDGEPQILDFDPVKDSFKQLINQSINLKEINHG